MFHGHMDYFQRPLLGGKSNTKLRDHDTLSVYNCWFIIFYHVWGPVWIDVYWNIIWYRDRSHMASHYTWGSMTKLHDFGGVLGQPLNTFFWALTINGHKSRLVCEVALMSGEHQPLHWRLNLVSLTIWSYGMQYPFTMDVICSKVEKMLMFYNIQITKLTIFEKMWDVVQFRLIASHHSK